MWKIAKHVTHIPFVDQQISDEDAAKIMFPLMTQNLFDIFLGNKHEKTYITYLDNRFCKANEQRAKEEDRITISFIPKSCSNVAVDLVMEDVYRYTGGLIPVAKFYNESRKTYNFGSVKIAITIGGETPGFKPQTKYCVSLPWADLIFVEANVVYLSDARYIDA